MQYNEAFPDLADVYLEDSWVLEVAPSDDGVAFRLDAVLTPEHALYRSPKPGEQYCYRAAWLSLRSERAADVQLSGDRPTVDPTGEPDFGQLDVFAYDPADDCWELEGNWGTAKFRSPTVALRFA